jgi:hypothetical protein
MLSAACQHTAVRQAFNYAADLGVAVDKVDHTCLYIANAGLSPGQRLQFVTASAPQTAGEMEILGKADDTCMDPNQDGPSVFGSGWRWPDGVLPSVHQLGGSPFDDLEGQSS